MNPLPLPSNLLRAWSRLTRWLLALVITAWLVLGMVWATLHWLIVPRINEFRPQLEAQASQALGNTVRIGAITAQSAGLVPSFELRDVALLDKQGRVALSLPRILVAVSPRSALHLAFEQIYVDQPQLDVRRARDGKVTVAGLDFSGPGGGNNAGLDWFFSQIEFAIHDGSVRWTDEQRGAEPIELAHVSTVVRNLGRHHDLRLDATPPEAWGERFSLRGKLLQPLLSPRHGQWQDWDGQLYAEFGRVDLSRLRQYVDLGIAVSQGQGAVRAWLDLKKGRPDGVMADLALNQVDVTLGHDLPALQLLELNGRLGGKRLADGFELVTRGLSFHSPDGLLWPGGDTRMVYQEAGPKAPQQGEFQAERLDLAALAQVLQRLPLAPDWRAKLAALSPQGHAEKLVLTWQGPLEAPLAYAARGRVSQLEWAAQQPIPGVRGLALEFALDQRGGRATMQITQGAVDLPGVFEQSLVDVSQLSGLARWTINGEQLALDVSELQFANPDAQGQGRLHWETSNPDTAANHSRFPGKLDLQASLSRAEGRQVHRYLPLVLHPDARAYVRQAVLGGNASKVSFEIRGDIDQMPLGTGKRDRFRISADVHDATLAFVPRYLQPAGELPWPTLNRLDGQLVIDRMQLQVKNARAQSAEVNALQVSGTEVTIADLNQAVIQVNGQIKGPLAEGLKLVNQSAIAAVSGDVLREATGNADVTLKLALNLPLADLSKSSVLGTLTLPGNDVQITRTSPKLGRARGSLSFSEVGLTLAGAQARLLGGDAQLEGGLVYDPRALASRGRPNLIQARGTATAMGLRQATELGWLTQLGQHASGSASYVATLGIRDSVPELLVQSNLQGLAVDLPAPLQKTAATPMVLRFQTQVLPNLPGVTGVNDRMTVEVGQALRLNYERDQSGPQARVLRGVIAVGADVAETHVLPSKGVDAHLRLGQLNLDAWHELLHPAAGRQGAAAANVGVSDEYLPNLWTTRVDALTFGGRAFNHVLVNGARDGGLWHAYLKADEVNGYVEYRQGTGLTNAPAGRVFARLAHLKIAPSTAETVETLLDAQPASIPALDILIEDFELAGKSLGRMEVEAINRALPGSGDTPVQEWRLNKFNLTVPEAKLTASGNWARVNAQAEAGAIQERSPNTRRRTVLSFKLDVTDGGALLKRFGMDGVVRQTSGKMEGQVAWLGSPLRLDYPSLNGAFAVNMAAGQFLKADPGIAKLFGVLSLQSLPRRLTLDFRDVFSDGFAFDFVRGDVLVSQGIAHTNNLQMKGVNAAVLMEGQADLARETQDLKVVVVPEINAGTASLIATVINPAVGLGTFLAQLFLRRPLTESNTQEFHINGNWADPQVTRVHKQTADKKEGKP